MIRIVVTALAILLPLTLANAQEVNKLRDAVNSGTVGLLAGRADSAFTRLSDDLGIALDESYQFRVLTILGRGSLSNIEDLLFLRGVDIAITQSDVLEFYKKIGAFPDVEKRIDYIAKIHSEEFHLLARTEIRDVQDLVGKKVNFGRPGTGTFLTASVVFDALNLDLEATDYPHRKALEMLKAGEISAMAKVDGKPVDVISAASIDDGLRLISLPVDQLAGRYEAATLDAGDYPKLFAPTDVVNTVAVSTVLAAYNWPEGHARRQNLDTFISAVFNNIDELRNPENGYDSKWADIDLTADVPGWQRDSTAAKLISQGGKGVAQIN